MKFSELFDATIKLWPKSIYIGDCSLHGADGMSCPSLTEAWDVAESKADKIDEWQGLMCWCIFAELHRVAKCKVLEGAEDEVFLSEVDIKNIERRCYRDLSEPEWSEYMKDYVNDLKNIS